MYFLKARLQQTKVSPLTMSQADRLFAINSIFLFEEIPIIFQAIQNHHGEQRASEVCQIFHYLSALILSVTATFSYRVNSTNIITLKMNIYRLI